MKLVCFEHGERAGARPIGAVKGDAILDLVAAGCRWTTIRDIAGGGADALDAVQETVAQAEPTLALNEVRLLAPIARPGKYLATGMSHTKRLGRSRTRSSRRRTKPACIEDMTICR